MRLGRVYWKSQLGFWTVLANTVAALNAKPASTNSGPQNPFAVIAVRNAFGVKTSTPKVEPAPTPPPVEKIKVSLAGVGELDGHKMAFLVVYPPSPGPHTEPEYLTLSEGETAQDGYNLKAISIDEDNETVRVENNGQDVTLNIKDDGLKPTGQTPAPAPMPTIQYRHITTAGAASVVPPPPAAAPGGPVVIGHGGIR